MKEQNSAGKFIDCDPNGPVEDGAALIFEVNGIVWGAWSNDDEAEFIEAMSKHSEIGCMVEQVIESGEFSVVSI